MSVKGEVKPLSFDHKPLNECEFLSNMQSPFLDSAAAEMTRIRNAGGYIEYGRVNGKQVSINTFTISFINNHKSGNLALSRAIGGFEFKKNNALAPEDQIITANPDIVEHELTGEDEFLVLACDGR